mmetsp:Transcript_21419/g.31500  ORF Transcript_21419/g.31500 Transcript_21419/m.31500 type:complete len:111 (-) Transcript_21419:33-365(-)
MSKHTTLLLCVNLPIRFLSPPCLFLLMHVHVYMHAHTHAYSSLFVNIYTHHAAVFTFFPSKPMRTGSSNSLGHFPLVSLSRRSQLSRTLLRFTNNISVKPFLFLKRMENE